MHVPDAITRRRSSIVIMYLRLPEMSSLSKITELKSTRSPLVMNCSEVTFCWCAPPVMSYSTSITCTSLTGCAKKAAYWIVNLPVFLSYQSEPLLSPLSWETYDDTEFQLVGSRLSLMMILPLRESSGTGPLAAATDPSTRASSTTSFFMVAQASDSYLGGQSPSTSRAPIRFNASRVARPLSAATLRTRRAVAR